MKDCTEYAALLDLYVDGELSAEEMEPVRAHLAVCPGCQAYVDDALAMRAAFPEVEDAQVPENFTQTVMAAIQKVGSPAPVKPNRPHRKPMWLKTLVPLAACVAIVVLVQQGPFRAGTGADTSAAPAEKAAPEAAMYSAADSAPESPQPPQTGGSGTAEDSGAPESLSPRLSAANGPEAAPTLTLTAEEAGALLAAYSPVQETDTALYYELTASEFAALFDALEQSGALLAGVSPVENGESAFVTVLK
ncbi:anti-sigma factor [Oscillibacter sp.]|uniref:anti-sigma factor family protein n=1 Tax=Oscillibacter sp. TaxID=1945593 RepID=UPI00263545F5|nr:zf-HC2 domain-containing protein [Oscillibacter sp.]MDD3346747.1 zf-HC2 domain-containing protein [Oscillibacter sp.]